MWFLVSALDGWSYTISGDLRGVGDFCLGFILLSLPQCVLLFVQAGRFLEMSIVIPMIFLSHT